MVVHSTISGSGWGVPSTREKPHSLEAPSANTWVSQTKSLRLLKELALNAVQNAFMLASPPAHAGSINCAGRTVFAIETVGPAWWRFYLIAVSFHLENHKGEPNRSGFSDARNHDLVKRQVVGVENIALRANSEVEIIFTQAFSLKVRKVSFELESDGLRDRFGQKKGNLTPIVRLIVVCNANGSIDVQCTPYLFMTYKKNMLVLPCVLSPPCVLKPEERTRLTC
ncbi:hypothetical protein PsorP6_015206 [Peronosclerospora sorghi]|uniref:Uncharacterized protein n=1 Tax=Peronosclerospora sorghi TaxID=230839 RepID=A0ACC0VSV8_9STRA|nr:hypothetical protein PsorP6_015206 [Peronosclerospora sorghi]